MAGMRQPTIILTLFAQLGKMEARLLRRYRGRAESIRAETISHLCRYAAD